MLSRTALAISLGLFASQAAQANCRPGAGMYDPCWDFNKPGAAKQEKETRQVRNSGVPMPGPNGPEAQFAVGPILPVGANIPAGSADDLFGLRLGAKFDDVKPVLEKRITLVPEKPMELGGALLPGTKVGPVVNEHGQPIYENFREVWSEIFKGQSFCGGANCSSSANGRRGTAAVLFRRALEATSSPAGGPMESYYLSFSTPASGHQLVAVTYIGRFGASSQPLIEDWLEVVGKKFGGTPVKHNIDEAYIVFDGGRQVRNAADLFPGFGRQQRCSSFTDQSIEAFSQPISMVNQAKVPPCGLSVKLSWSPGISERHASSITVRLIDAQRFVANVKQDVGFATSSEAGRLQGATAGKPQL